ncbi:hypothetical protein MA16_Dca027502 [Dendrobium catenatum]|uniref:Uncharacterized protein n=1 Tax=Dendrobium catenatum TaxID=906689 RepID=A0A2I0VC00_9ASPA|nr:hypothetical protein MA16_Dca027502 [Dendrobium catenatum]
MQVGWSLAERRKRLEAETKVGKSLQDFQRRWKKVDKALKLFQEEPAGYGFQKSHYHTHIYHPNIYYL